MLDLAKLGWDPKTVGELDHNLVKAPYVRLATYKQGAQGDLIYTYDIRITQPNTRYLTTPLLHSFEHLLLAGCTKYIAENFINVAPMGCQTGFYLVCVNFGEKEKLLHTYEKILQDIITSTEVPYASLHSCGQYCHHDLAAAITLAQELLNAKNSWDQVF